MSAAARARRARGEGGNVSLMIVILMPVLVLAAGLVLDGGRQVQARREAYGIAAEAARAGVQLSTDEAFADRLDPARAAGRAQVALSARGATGAVSVQGERVTVVVDAHVDYLIMPGSGTVRQQASARASRGVNAGSP